MKVTFETTKKDGAVAYIERHTQMCCEDMEIACESRLITFGLTVDHRNQAAMHAWRRGGTDQVSLAAAIDRCPYCSEPIETAIVESSGMVKGS